MATYITGIFHLALLDYWCIVQVYPMRVYLVYFNATLLHSLAQGYGLSNTTGPEGFGAAANPIVYRGFFSWTIFICFLISLVYFDTWPHILQVKLCFLNAIVL